MTAARNLVSRLLLCLLPAVPAAAADHTVLRTDRSAVIEMRTAALIMSGQQGGALPIALGVLPRGDDATTVVVEIDGAALLEHAAAETVTVEVFAYVLGDGLDVVEVVSCALDVDLELHRGLLSGTGLKVFLPLARPAGDQALRVLARAGDAFGVRVLEPAEAPRSAPRILRPVFHELAQPWLLAVAGDATLPPPFGLDGEAPLPTTRPILSPGETLSAQVYLDGADAGPGTLVARVRSPGGDAVEVPLEVAAHDGDALTAVTVSLTAPDLAPGLYEVAVAAGDARSSFVPLFVDAGTATPAPDAVATEPGAPRPQPSRSQRQHHQAIVETYAQALRQLAAGDRTAALATLDAAESRIVDALDAEGLRLLAQAESSVLARLDADRWECVLPVILLHLDAGRGYARDRRHILAHHATQMTVAMAEAYAAKLATPEAAREAAGAVASLAGHKLQGGSLSRAERLFAEALALADDEAAWLGLAAIHEKRGHYEEALAPLQSFVAARPGHAEARLRLALNRARSGRAEEARQALERLTAGPGDGWVTLLAYQELARLEMDGERWAEAAEILGRGLRRWPGQPTLTLQLAWVLDARGEPLASQQLLAGLDLEAVPEPGGERSRYNRWPWEVLQETRRELAAAAAARLGDLGRWLETLETQ